MTKRKSLAVALTIAGSDSGGGAGIQADLKTFAALGVHGTSVIACLTAQHPGRVRGVEACSRKMLRQQLEAVFTGLPPAAIKTGMLFSAAHIRLVADFLKTAAADRPLVVDPVMIATSGTRLLAADALSALQHRLLPLATLITPNLDEAGVLAEMEITSLEMMCLAARKLQARFGATILLKGGHLKGCREATDVFFDGRTERLLAAPFIRGMTTHGTGCTYSAAVCAGLAEGKRLVQAVATAKEFITGAIAGSHPVGKSFVLAYPAGAGQRFGRRRR